MEAMSQHEEFAIPAEVNREDRAAQVRVEFPESAEAVDQMRALFGADCVVLTMEESGKAIIPKNYKKDSDYNLWFSGAEFLRVGKLNQQASDYAERTGKYAKRK